MDDAIIKRVQPNSPEAEQAVIGAMLISRDAITAASEIVTEEDFYQPRYAILFKAIMEMYNDDKQVDLVTFQNKLKEMGVSPELSSLEFISNLIQSVPTASNVRHYATIVSNKAVSRRLIKSCESIANTCYLDKEDLDMVLESSEKQIFDIVQNRGTKDYEKIQDIVIRALTQIEASAKNKGNTTGVPTGFYELDYKTAGLQKSDLILLAARPSMGKTALALNIAEHAVVDSHISTAFFSLEMSSVQLVNRLLAMNSRVSAQNIRTGKLNDNEWASLMESARILGGSTLIIDDTPGITISELRSKCRKMKMENDLGLVIIDYLQLMSAGRKVESRQQEISEISRSLKSIAREINCPILALSQLSRAVEARPDKRPMLSDLRESGAIEQDADVVMFIYRDEYYNHDSSDKGVAEVIIGKQRNGPTGTIKLGCQLEFTRFTNLERQADNYE